MVKDPCWAISAGFGTYNRSMESVFGFLLNSVDGFFVERRVDACVKPSRLRVDACQFTAYFPVKLLECRGKWKEWELS